MIVSRIKQFAYASRAFFSHTFNHNLVWFFRCSSLHSYQRSIVCSHTTSFHSINMNRNRLDCLITGRSSSTNHHILSSDTTISTGFQCNCHSTYLSFICTNSYTRHSCSTWKFYYIHINGSFCWFCCKCRIQIFLFTRRKKKRAY